jgi:hypothetical protein
VGTSAGDYVTATDLAGQNEVAVIAGVTVLRRDGTRIPLVPEREVAGRQLNPLLPNRGRATVCELITQHFLGRHVVEVLDRRSTFH